MVKRSDKVKERIKQGLRKYSKTLQRAIDEKLNEADTRSIVNNILGEALGYDEFFDVTGEFRIRGQYADYVLRIDKNPKVVVEVKAINTCLNENHLRQVTNYAANEGIEWIILTNGNVWQLYHLTFSKPIENHLVFTTELLSKDIKPREKVELLYLLTKESVTKNEIKDYWHKKLALSAVNVLKILLSEPILQKVRRELSARSGYRIGIDDLRDLLQTQVIKKQLL